MSHISNVLNLSDIRKQKEHEESEVGSTETADVINWLFKELRSSFTAFKQAWPTQEEYTSAKKVWLKAFILSGINTVEKIQHGLNRCYLMEKPFVPSPGEFISWCSPKLEDVGLPPFEKAYQMSILINRQFSDYRPECNKTFSVIRHAIDQIGPMEYRAMRAESAYKTFERYYALSCRQFIEGGLREIPRAISDRAESHPVDKARSDEARKKTMDALRNIGLDIQLR